MRAELEQKIQEARERLGLGALTAEQRAEQERTQAMDEFKIFLAGRIEPWTRIELLMGAEYFWGQTGPAVRFGVDNHVFLLARCGDDAGLFVEEAAGERRELVRLAADDPQFDDRLLAGIGDALQASFKGGHCAVEG
jgi:hypothetical protein